MQCDSQSMKARIERGWKGRIASPGSTAGAESATARSSVARAAPQRLLAAGEEVDHVGLSRQREPATVPGLGDQPRGGAPQLHPNHSAGLALAIGWPARRKRGGGGPPHWLIAPKPPGQRFAS